MGVNFNYEVPNDGRFPAEPRTANQKEFFFCFFFFPAFCSTGEKFHARILLSSSSPSYPRSSAEAAFTPLFLSRFLIAPDS